MNTWGLIAAGFVIWVLVALAAGRFIGAMIHAGTGEAE